MLAALQSVAPAAAPVPDSEFEWHERDFETVRQLIERRAGIRLNDRKQAMVYSRLSRRLRATRHQSFSGYLSWLQSQDGQAPEWQQFVNALTTNLTSFFRESHHFEMLARHVARGGARHWRGWCCAASTGEEPASIAMTLAESLPSGATWELLASDIDTTVLATARAGVYPMERIEGIDAVRRQRHFLRGSGPNAGLARLRPELGARIRYERINLMDAKWPVEPGLDFVFCRNVLIYFDHASQREVVRRLHGLLAPGAMLFVGHAESLAGAREALKPIGRTAYQKA